ncbi:MAG: hypothetical protein FJ034_08405, partial [Chloroflexi bacterium]|nr:hypothetical protein [Chloroflexota bacterium]
MEAVPLPAAEVSRWDALVAACPAPHILQTVGWAELKQCTGWEPRRFVLRDGARVAGVAQVLLKRLPLGLSAA